MEDQDACLLLFLLLYFLHSGYVSSWLWQAVVSFFPYMQFPLQDIHEWKNCVEYFFLFGLDLTVNEERISGVEICRQILVSTFIILWIVNKIVNLTSRIFTEDFNDCYSFEPISLEEFVYPMHILWVCALSQPI